MRFIGSKKLLTNQIEKVIQDNLGSSKKAKVFCDIFSGTASVGNYFKKRYSVISNDVLYFSYVLQKAQIEQNKLPTFNKLKKIGISDPFSFLNHLETPKRITKNDFFIYENFSPHSRCDRQYLTNENAIHIDQIRLQLNTWLEAKVINSSDYFFLLASLIDYVPSVSNIAGTYGAFLKNWDKRAFKDIELSPLPTYDNKKKNKSYNEDGNDLVRKIKGDILYIDPPYNSRQYLPNYHLLETIARYDSPKLKGVTGLRDDDSKGSKYCRKSEAEGVLYDLISSAKFEHIILSYSTEGLIQEKSLKQMMKGLSKGKSFKLYRIPYRRYKRIKKKSNNNLFELIFYIEKK